MSNNQDREWDDDDRNPICRTRHYVSARTETSTPLGGICKAILGDLDASKNRILWNEVEHINYTYEPVCIEEDMQVNTVEQDDVPNNKKDEQVNHQCFDSLVKNSTAYL